MLCFSLSGEKIDSNQFFKKISTLIEFLNGLSFYGGFQILVQTSEPLELEILYFIPKYGKAK